MNIKLLKPTIKGRNFVLLIKSRLIKAEVSFFEVGEKEQLILIYY